MTIVEIVARAREGLLLGPFRGWRLIDLCPSQREIRHQLCRYAIMRNMGRCAVRLSLLLLLRHRRGLRGLGKMSGLAGKDGRRTDHYFSPGYPKQIGLFRPFFPVGTLADSGRRCSFAWRLVDCAVRPLYQRCLQRCFDEGTIPIAGEAVEKFCGIRWGSELAHLFPFLRWITVPGSNVLFSLLPSSNAAWAQLKKELCLVS